MHKRTLALLLGLSELGGCAPSDRSCHAVKGCGSVESRVAAAAPRSGEVDGATWAEAWERTKATRANLHAVALAAYMFEGNRRTATIEDMVDRSELPCAIDARGRTRDVWGRRLRLHYRSMRRLPGDVVVTSAGPDDVFDTDDDVRLSTWGWQ